MSSLRHRRGIVPAGNAIPEFGQPPAAPGAENTRTVFRFSRDPAVDQTTPQGFATVGLAGNPDPPAPLGAQSSDVEAGGESPLTRTGRPGRFRLLPFRPQSRDLDHENRGTLAPGTIRRNVRYPINGIPAPSFFSWAANALGIVDSLDPARPPQDEYLVSSAHLQLPDSLATVVSGTAKPAPGLEPFRSAPTVQAGASTGYPVIAPQVPSYGSRVPLRRPRGLVTVNDAQ